MKKLLFLFLSVFLLGNSLLQAQQTITIGTGTTTDYGPLCNWYGYERYVTLYPSTELTTGEILSVAWNYPSVSLSNIPIKIYVKEVSSPTLPSAANLVWNTLISDATLIYDGNASWTALTSWVTLAAQHQFIYTGSGNLMVLIACNSGGSGGNSCNWRYTAASSSDVINAVIRRDGSIDDNISFEANKTGTYSSQADNKRYNLRLSIQPIEVTCPYVNNPAISDITITSANITWETGGSETQWLVSYKKQSETQWSSEAMVTTHQYPLSSLASNTNYQARVRSYCGVGDTSFFRMVSFKTLETCPSPTNLILAHQADSLLPHQAVLNWTAGNVETSWILEYKETSSSTWNSVTIGQRPYTLTGLDHARKYDIRLRAYCGVGDTSFNYTNTLSITTPMTPFVLPYSLNFENGTDNWVISNGAATTNLNKWYRGTIPTSTGNCLFISNSLGSSNKYNVDNSSVSHFFHDIVVPATGATIAFDWRAGGELSGTTYSDYLTVGLFETTQLPVAGTLLNSSPAVKLANPSNPVWKRDTIVIPASSTGIKRLVFSWKNDGSSGTQPPAAIDNISILPITCVAPTGLAVDNLTTTSATLTWTNPSNAQTVTLEYKESSATGWITINNVSSPYVLPGLTNQATYNVRVKANCGGDGISLSSDMLTFKVIAPAIAPYTCTFEDNTENNNWISVYSGTKDRWVIGNKTNNGGSNAMYVANSSGEYTYSTENNYANIYRDVTFPASTDGFVLKFDWKCKGEGPTSDYDNVKVFLLDKATPVTAAACAADKRIGANWYNQNEAWATATINLGSSYALTTKRLVFQWKTDASYSYPPPGAIDNLSISLAPCSLPLNLTVAASSVTAASAEVTWSLQGSATSSVLEYKASSATEWTVINNAVSPLTIQGLTSNTTYDVRVKSLCEADNYSPYSTTVSFTTLCSAVSLPWIETFNGSTFPPTCWSRMTGLLTASSSVTPTTSGWTSTTINSNPLAYLLISSTDKKHWLVTPPVDLGDGSTLYTLTFKLAGSASSTSLTAPTGTRIDDTLAVVISLDGGSTWSSANILRLWNNTGSAYVFNDITNTFQDVSIPLTGYTGNVRIAFYGQSTISNGSNYYFIDDVVITSCPSIAGLSVPLATITATGAQVTWTSPAEETTVTLEYKTTDADTWIVAGNNVTSPYTLSGLSSNTAYMVRVKPDCGALGSGVYSTQTFTTNCVAVTSPWVETFEGSFPPTCWTRFTGALGESSTLTSATSGWVSYTVSGDKVAGMNMYNTNMFWIVTPPIDLETGTIPYQLSFDLIVAKYNSSGNISTPPEMTGTDDVFAVLISTDNGTTWSSNNALRLWDNQGSPYVLNSLISNVRQTITLPLTGYSGNVKIAFYGGSTINNADNNFYIDNVTITGCPPIVGLAVPAATITAAGAQVTWTTPAEGTTVTLEYKAADADTWIVAGNNVTSPYTLSGLSSNTAYMVRVKSDCGAFGSGIYTTQTFTTNCAAVVLPWIETFNGSTFPPTCWSRMTGLLTASSSVTPTTSGWTSGTISSDPLAYLSISSTDKKHWLVTPPVDLGDGSTNYTLTFKLAGSASSTSLTVPTGTRIDDTLAVVISLDGGNTWSNANILRLWDNAGSAYVFNDITNTFQDVSIPLTGYTGNVKIAFYGQSTISNGTNYYFINDVVIASCPSIAGLSVPSATITATEAQVTWTAPAGGATAVLEYKAASATDWIVINNAETPYTLPGLSPVTAYNVRMKADCGSGNNGIYSTVNFTTVTSCVPPTALDVPTATITETTAVVTWTPPANAQSSVLEYKLSSATEWTVSSFTASPATLTGLLSASSYDVRVKSDCGSGDVSPYTSVKTFMTLCAPVASVPWYESFEGYTDGMTALPCFTQVSETGSKSWTVNQTYTTYNRTPRTGIKNITLGWGATQWLFKKLHLEAGTIYNVTLYARQDDPTPSYANVTVSYGTTTTIAGMTSNIIPQTSVINGNYQKLSNVFIVPTTGDYFIGIRGYISSSPYYLSMDDISVVVEPCAVVVSSVSGITENTATVDWIGSSATESVVLEYKTTSASTWTTASGVLTSPYTITGLLPSTSYQIRMKSNCAEGVTSSYVTTTFTTTAGLPATLPYRCDFENTAENAKWKSIYSGTNDRWVIGNQTNNGGDNSMYIANSSGSYTYSTTNNYANIYRDVTFSAGNEFELSFDWKCKGEGTTSDYDNVKVFLLDEGATVTAGACAATKRVGLTWYNDNPDWSRATISLGSAYANTTKRLVFQWKTDGSTSNQPPGAIDNIAISVVTCPAPTTLEVPAENISSTFAELQWNAPAGIQYSLLEYKSNLADEWTVIEGADSPYYLMDLLPSLTYQVRVRSYCGEGDTSRYSNTASFTTLCGPVVLPWMESFSGSIFPPLCWTRFSGLLASPSVLTPTTSGWSSSTVNSNKEAYLSISSTTTQYWLVTPEIDLGSGNTEYVLTFKLAGSKSSSNLTDAPSGNRDDDKLAVIISTDGGTTWSSDYTLRQWDNQGSADVFNSITNTFQEVSIPLMGFTGSVKIGFYGESTAGDVTNYYHIDDVAVSSCPVPTALQVPAATITSGTAIVNWEPASGSASSILEYKLNTATEWIVFPDVTPPYQLTDLIMGTSYNVRVKSFCGGNNYGNYTQPVTFISGCQAVALPWTDTFDGEFPGCWTRFKDTLAVNTDLIATTDRWTSVTVNNDKMVKINIYGGGTSATDHWFVTPEINLGSGSTKYELTFDLIGAKHSSTPSFATAPETTGTDDKFAVVISTDGGLTWSSNNTLRLWDNQGSPYVFNNIKNTWQSVKIPLHQYSGTVKIAFYGESLISNADNDYFIDNVSVLELPSADITLLSIDPIVSSCELGNKPVTIHVENFGKDPITSFTAKYKIGAAGVPVSEIVTPVTPIATNEQYAYTFVTNANFPEGNDTLIVMVEVTGDQDLSDNMLSTTLRRYPAGTIPYVQDFNALGTDYYLENWSVWDLNLDSKKFSIGYYVEPDYFAYYSYNDLVDANDWLISSCIDIPAGTYRVSYDYGAMHPYYAENMEVYIGSSNNPEAMTTQVGNHQGFTNVDFTNHHARVDLDGGIYYVGVHASSVKGGMGIKFDNLKIDKVYVITADLTGAGTITPMGDTMVAPDATVEYTITPTDGATLIDVLVDGLSVGAVTSYTFNNISANHTIEAQFTHVIHQILASAGPNGTISPSGSVPVEHGQNQTFTFTPATGYHVETVTVNGNPRTVAGNSYTITNVRGDSTIHVTFAINVYTINATAGINGTITPSGSVSVQHGQNQTFTITPNEGYQIQSIMVDGTSVGTTSPYTFTNVTANHTIAVSFMPRIHTVSATAGSNGTITPSGSVPVQHGNSQMFTFTPATGYHVQSVMVNSTPRTFTGNTHTLTNVRGDSTIHVTFAINTYTVNASVDGVGGTITPLGESTVQYGGSIEYTITPDPGYMMDQLLLDGTSVTPSSDGHYTVSNVTSNRILIVSFVQYYTITATSSDPAKGNITPSGAVKVRDGGDQIFEITTEVGFDVADIRVDGVSVGSFNEYIFTNVTEDHTITVDFTVGIKDPTISSIKVYSSEHKIYISNNGQKLIKEVDVFDNYGKLVYKGSVTDNPEIIPLMVSTGNYVVRIITEDQVGVYKVFVQQR